MRPYFNYFMHPNHHFIQSVRYDLVVCDKLFTFVLVKE